MCICTYAFPFPLVVRHLVQTGHRSHKEREGALLVPGKRLVWLFHGSWADQGVLGDPTVPPFLPCLPPAPAAWCWLRCPSQSQTARHTDAGVSGCAGGGWECALPASLSVAGPVPKHWPDQAWVAHCTPTNHHEFYSEGAVKPEKRSRRGPLI